MDIYEEVTRRIVEQMEQGEIPWHKPWIAGGNCVSYATGKPYSLLNQMILGKPGEYLTFRQCQQAGGHIRRGVKAHMTEADTDTITAGAFRVTWKPVTSTRIDTAALRKELPEVWQEYGKTTTTRRFNVTMAK